MNEIDIHVSLFTIQYMSEIGQKLCNYIKTSDICITSDITSFVQQKAIIICNNNYDLYSNNIIIMLNNLVAQRILNIN